MAYKTIKPVRVPAAIQSKYKKKLEALVEKTHRSLLYWLKSVYRKNEDAITDSPTSALSKELRQLKAYWKRMYGQEAEDIAKWFATQMRRHTAGNLEAQFKQVSKAVGGFDLDFKYMSQKERFVFRAIVESNVNLIKSIGEQYLTQVQGIVLRSIEVGNDLGEMTESLDKQYDITARRAAMISRDQTAKANENLSRTRLMDYGVTQGRWMHTSSGKTYRESHLQMDGEIYDLSQGCFDPDYGGYIHPAELVNCRCVCVPIIPTGEPVEQGYYASPGQTGETTPSGNKNIFPSEAGENRWGKEILNELEGSGVKYHPVKPLTKQLSEKDIIDRIATVGDEKGKCSSLAMAYVGNKAGLDVLVKDNETIRNIMGSPVNLMRLAKSKGVDGIVKQGNNDIKTVNSLLNGMKIGKEYYLGTGKHAAIVRKTANGYEYLELQPMHEGEPGWRPLRDQELLFRFGAKLEDGATSVLIDIDDMAKSDLFIEMLGYL